MIMKDVNRATVGVWDNKTGTGVPPPQVAQNMTGLADELEAKNRIGTEGSMLKALGGYALGVMLVSVGAVVTGGVSIGSSLAGLGIAAGLPVMAGLLSSRPLEMEPAPAVKPGVSLSRASKMSSPQINRE